MCTCRHLVKNVTNVYLTIYYTQHVTLQNGTCYYRIAQFYFNIFCTIGFLYINHYTAKRSTHFTLPNPRA